MKKITYLILLFLSVFAFTNCSDDIGGTEDINYVSFEGSSISMVVNKNSSADRVVKVYATQITGADRVFTIKALTDLSTADPAAYSIPSSVTIPANTNVGEFTVTISDVNIAANGVKLILGFESQNDLLTGANMTVNMMRFCPLVIEDFLGDYVITEKGYGDYATTITLDPDVANRIWITNFWDWTNDLAYYDFDPENGTVTMPSQVIVMGDGGSYTCIGTGTYNACSGTFHMEYDGDVANTVHDFTPLALYSAIVKSADKPRRK